jgi:hypothetical protein
LDLRERKSEDGRDGVRKREKTEVEDVEERERCRNGIKGNNRKEEGLL